MPRGSGAPGARRENRARLGLLATVVLVATLSLAAGCGGGNGSGAPGSRDASTAPEQDATAVDATGGEGGQLDSTVPSGDGGDGASSGGDGSPVGSSDASDSSLLSTPNAYSAPTAAADLGIYNPAIYFKILNKNSGRVLSINGGGTDGGGTDNGDNAIISDDVNADDQLWSIFESVQGFKKLISKKSGRALSTDHHGTTSNGTTVQLWQYLGSAPDQDWSISPGNAGAVKITSSARAAVALSLDGAGTANDTLVQVRDDTGAVDQDWIIEPVQTFDPTTQYMLLNKNSNTALSVYQGGTGNDDPADLYSFVNQPDQYWSVVDAGGGYYNFVNSKSGRYLSLTGGATTDGIIAMIYDYVTGAADQGWSIEAQPSGFYQLSNEKRPSGVLSIVGSQTTSQSQAEINDNLGTPDQSWSIVPVGNAIIVNALDVQASLSGWMTGSGMEDVNHEIYGGIFSQMIFGESFQEPAEDGGAPGVSGTWDPVTTGSATGSFALLGDQPYQGTQYESITYGSGAGEVGVANQGLDRWGIHFTAGQPYDGYLYARSAGSVSLSISAESSSGATAYAQTSVTVNQASWTRYDFSFTPSAADPAGRVTLGLQAPGTVDVGYVYVEPGPWGRYAGLPVRNDIAQMMGAQRNTVLRFGGSAILADGYRWKNMTGPREQRPVLSGWWYPYDSNGWGIFEFLSYAEAMGVLGLPTLNIDELPADMADFVDYVNGPVTTTWGAQRAADGHPAPFGIHRIELGNEELVDDAFATKFNQLAAAIWAKDPAMVLTVGDMGYNDVIAVPTQVTGAQSGLTTLEAYQSILDFAASNNGPLAIDMHTWTDNPQEVLEEVDAIASFDFWVHAYNPNVNYALNIYELNANAHDLDRALGNARAIGLLEQHGRRVKIVTSANALQPDGHNDNGWDQGLVFFDTQQSWLQPPGYVTQMIANDFLPTVVHSLSTNPDLTVTAKMNGSVMTLEVVNLNISGAAQTPTISFIGYVPSTMTAQVTQLSGNLGDENSASATALVAPEQSSTGITVSGGSVTYSFPPNSFTVLGFQ